MFWLIGFGERAGSGLITIQNAWKKQHWQPPFQVLHAQNEK